jgi:hypothetical protein
MHSCHRFQILRSNFGARRDLHSFGLSFTATLTILIASFANSLIGATLPASGEILIKPATTFGSTFLTTAILTTIAAWFAPLLHLLNTSVASVPW